MFILRKKVIKEIYQILRRFIWSGVKLKNTWAKVVWEDVCYLMDEGGMGIKNLAHWNKGPIMRHIWDLARKKGFLMGKMDSLYFY